MSLPLGDPIALVAALLGVVFLAVWLTDRFRWARQFSPVLWILLFAALLTNLGVLVPDAPLYGAIAGQAVPLAVCLLLFTVRLSAVREAGRAMLAAFALAALGTIVGVVVASVVTAGWMAEVLGNESWKIAGPFVGTYVGGSLNFFALWDGLEIGRPDLLAAANAVDNLAIFPLLAIWLLLPKRLAGRYPVAPLWRLDAKRQADGPAASSPDAQAPATSEGAAASTPRLRIDHVIALAFLAVTVVWLSGALARALDRVVPGIPEILIVTTLALAAGQWRRIRDLEGGWEIGTLVFYLFFAAVGALIDVAKAVLLSPVLFVYVSIIVVFHMLVVYGGGRLLKMDVGVLTVASITTKAGPPLVLALAEELGWKRLVLPGVFAGLLGYAIGNYLGFAVAQLVRALLPLP